MPFFIRLICCCFLVGGCATTHKTTSPVPSANSTKAAPKEATSPALENIKDEAMAQYAEQKGVIFGSTSFDGVLKGNYVRLHFQGVGNNPNQYDLNIQHQPISAKNGPKMVESGYFFLELPAGLYKITSISIPVGSTMAIEDMDIDVRVFPNMVMYVGDLKITGTKERIKLGGVPVIRPGFEYLAEVVEQNAEAVKTFRTRYPNYKKDIKMNLMKLNLNGNQKKDITPQPVPLQNPNAQKQATF